MKGFIALFRTRTPTEDKIGDLVDDCIILTDSNMWDPVGLATSCTINATSNTPAVQRMKEKVPVEGLRVCATIEQDKSYIVDGGDQRLLSSISTALTDKTLLPCIVDCIHIVNTTSRNRHYDMSPNSLSEKL